MSSLNQKTLLKALRDKAYEGTPASFQDLLLRFGQGAEELAAIENGLKERESMEHAGDYIDSASPGYADMRRKQKILQEFYLGTGPFAGQVQAVHASQLPAAGGDSLQEQFNALKARVERLEARLELPPAMRLSRAPKP